jgi:prepilin-type N-terminal cleavage/methylation domain-containing protein
MYIKNRGFTLIELLIVIAIIGILSSLLIPNVLTAIQKTNQKSTMRDITTISTACVNYITENGNWEAVSQSGPISPANDFVHAITPFFVKSFAIDDHWGTRFNAWVGEDAVESAVAGIPAGDVSGDDFIISSYGRDKQEGPTYTSYDPADPGAGIYPVLRMADFNEDIVSWNGSWIIAPKVSKSVS